MATAVACPRCMHQSPSSAISRPNIAADPVWIKVICSYGGGFLRSPCCNACLRYTGGESKLVYINACLPLSSLVSELCSLFPDAGLDATRVSLKCRLPGDHLDAVVDVPDEYALRIAILGSLRSAKKLPRLLRKSGRLRFFLTVNQLPPEHVSSSSSADEEPPLIDLSSQTPTDETTPNDLLPEVLRLVEELKDGVSFGQAVAGQKPGHVRDNWPPPPPSRWLKSGRSKGNEECLTWPGATVTRILCDRTRRVMGHCTLDPTWQPKGVLVMGP